ncbi:MAG: metallophosphoesterase family protein [Candidatus Acidiferrales bacterium]
MKVLLFSDLHGDARALERLLAQPADLYISAGDLSTFGRGAEKLGELLRPLGERVWVIPGNHETAVDNRAFCEKFGLVDFHRQIKTFGGATWAGLGNSNPTPFDTPGEMTETEIAAALEAFNGQRALHFVVHFPPHGTDVDEVTGGGHAGSAALRAWVERERPAFLFCGHIHECAGKSDTLGATRCFSLGKQGYLLELP